MKFLMRASESDIWNNPEAWSPVGGYGSYVYSTLVGKSISVHRALKVSPFYAGVKLISNTLGMLPLQMYRRIDERSKERAPEHPIYQLLHSTPNPYMTANQWKRCMTANAILRGNAYSKIDWDGQLIRMLTPLSSDNMQVDFKENGEPVYLYYKGTEKERTFAFDDIFHLSAWGDGYNGISVVELAKETLGLALALEDHAARYFSNGIVFGGVLEAPKDLKLDKDAIERILASLNRRAAGVEKHHGWGMLENGITAKPLGMTNVESQFLEARKFVVLELSRFLGLPPHVLGELDRAIKANIEEQARALIMFHILPWIISWEQTVQRDLVLYPERYFAEFTVDMLLRGDTKARWEAYKTAIEHGVMNPDEVRAKENMNPREDGRGNRYWQPLNYSSFPGQIGEGEGEEGEPQEARAVQQPIVLVLSGDGRLNAIQGGAEHKLLPEKTNGIGKARAIADETIEQLVRREAAAINRWWPRLNGQKAKQEWANDWYAKNAMTLMERLRVTRRLAEEYCEQNKKELLDGGYELPGNWISEKAKQLAAIVFEEKG